MTPLDKYLQWLRLRQVQRRINHTKRLLDFGCFDGYFLTKLRDKIEYGLGLDIEFEHKPDSDGLIDFYEGKIDNLEVVKPFDTVIAAAVLEHLDYDQLVNIAKQFWRVTSDHATIIATLPSPSVDKVLFRMKQLKLIHGMDLESHSEVPLLRVIEALNIANWDLIECTKFEFGFNNLLTFSKRHPLTVT